MLIFNTKTSKKEELTNSGTKVRVYVCGPTVYDHAHLGHARSAISFDLLIRVLKSAGYDTLFARNITDVDDKIIKKMLSSGESMEKITEFYTNSYHNDLDSINCLRPDIEPKATENIDAMADMIKILLDKEIAYKISNGDIYFDTSKDDKYLSLSCRNSDEFQSRIDGEPEKKDPKDFVLWKAKNDDDLIYFNSIIGSGRPGWHLECSAMIYKHLAAVGEGDYQIDIHGGGGDLLFPHHENEAAQSRCAYGVELSKFWMHNGFVTINSEKMSKSLGNGFALNEAINLFGGEAVRNYLIQTHYRQDFNFSHEDLVASRKRLDRIYRLKKRVFGVSLSQVDSEYSDKILKPLLNDLNVSEALAGLEEFISASNERLDKNPKDKSIKSTIMSTIGFISDVLGLGYKNPYEYFQQGISDNEKKEIEELILERSEAKKVKNFALADDIRERLSKKGVAIMDMVDTTVWEINKRLDSEN